MANTFSKIYIQILFAVKNRSALINESFREEIQKYIAGIISHRECKLFAIYANPDHVHLLVSVKPNISISDLARDIKANSSKFINEQKLTKSRFQWQDGYGAFSYSQSQVNAVIQYIYNQPLHHKKRTFREEYLDLLNKFEIIYNDRYLFDWFS